MNETETSDLIIIGGGPAGYSAALRATRLGAKTTLIEKSRLGGACLNHACIPVKYLRYTAELLHNFEKAQRYGIEAETKRVDWSVVQSQRQNLIDGQVNGLGEVLKASGIRVVQGEAQKMTGKSTQVKTAAGVENYTGEKVILATGSVPAQLHFPGAEYALFYPGIIRAKELPRRLALIGGGPVGIELANNFSGFGSEVSVIEMMPHILPGEDAELVLLLEKELKKKGIRLFTGSTAKQIEEVSNGYRVTISSQNQEQVIDVNVAVLCTGQKPSTGSLDLTESGLTLEKGAIPVDEYLSTGVDGVYAAGDVTGKALLAYVALMQGRLAAENALGGKTAMAYNAIPHCIFSHPELAGVGLTEEEARAKGNIKVGRSLFSANPAATIASERRGLVKVLAGADDRLLGVHILGAEAPLLIHEAALPVRLGLPVSEIQQTLHAHPTLSETIWEACLNIV